MEQKKNKLQANWINPYSHCRCDGVTIQSGGCRMKLIVAATVAIFAATIAQAHGGGLNAEGCHNDRKTGDYHCHRGTSGGSRAAAHSYQVTGSGTATRPFANCTAARGARAAPVYAGTPGYGRHLDRDGDGVGCE